MQLYLFLTIIFKMYFDHKILKKCKQLLKNKFVFKKQLIISLLIQYYLNVKYYMIIYKFIYFKT